MTFYELYYDIKALKMIKVPPQIMTSYDRLANERPVYTVIDQCMVKFILASQWLFYRMNDVIICGGTLIIFVILSTAKADLQGKA